MLAWVVLPEPPSQRFWSRLLNVPCVAKDVLTFNQNLMRGITLPTNRHPDPVLTQAQKEM